MDRILVVPLNEIKAVRWTCPKCEAAVDFPLTEEKSLVPGDFGFECPVCAQGLASKNEPSRENNLKSLHSKIRQLREAGASIALVISDDR